MARSGEGLVIGDIYIVRQTGRTEMIPRDQVSYVSAEYSDRPIFLVLGLLALLLFMGCLLNLQFRLSIAFTIGLDPNLVIWLPAIVAVVFVLFYLVSRRGGVMIASSGGRLFVQTRGKARLELVERIRTDLAGLDVSVTGEGNDRHEPRFS